MIGVSGSMDREETKYMILSDYMRSLTEAGAAPVLLCPDMTPEELNACVNRLDGLMLAGGNDVDPNLYGQEPVSALGEVNPRRDRFETALIRAFLQAKKPIFGICRGIQAMNVALGGALWQDLPSQYRRPDGRPPMAHQQTCLGQYPFHRVTVADHSLLKRVLGVDALDVNTFHHQAVSVQAPGCVASAVADDGVIEAIELPGYPFVLGVQWHPERMTPADPQARRLFEAFVEAAGEGR